MKLVGAPGHRGQSELYWLPGVEISIQQSFKPRKDIRIDNLTGCKLPVVETKAMVKQNFYVGNYYWCDKIALVLNIIK